ncbi:MAG: sugar transferase [Planctomycetes bacterium]|nr:sugar transferase [Planctomycetota bacterium]
MVHVADATNEIPNADRPADLHALRDDSANLMRFHRQWADDADGSLHFLLPESMRACDWLSTDDFDGAPISWYSDQLSPTFSVPSDRRNVWIVNGSHARIGDWSSVRRAALPRNSDVMVFSPNDPAHDQPYDEMVRVDESKHILGFQRVYSDSPMAATPLPQPASLAVCRAGHARAVVAHLLRHGWSAASIGGLTRRFRVAWTDIPSACGGSAHAISGPDTHRSSVRTPRQTVWQSPPAIHKNGSPDTAVPDRGRSGVEGRVQNGHLTEAAIWDGSTGVESSDTPANSYLNLDEFKPKMAERREFGMIDTFKNPYDNRALYRFGKRTLDIVFSALFLLLASPMLLVVAAMIKLTSPGPVFFGHRRQGIRGEEFLCLKFRTMIKDADNRQMDLRKMNEVDGPQFKISNDPRLTRLGAWLTRTNIDEVPQFFNVLLGQMSLTGPRPSPDKENQFCPGWRRARLSVRPGITGLWQIMRLRNHADSDFQEWIYYDLEYVRHRSMWLDLQLLAYTPLAMYSGKCVTRFAQRLKARGICVHSARVPGEG